MKCPIDGSDLVMSDRQGIEIDYCPKCRGVWLDRGELDKIIERSAEAMPAQPAPQPFTQTPPAPQPQYVDPRQQGGYPQGGYQQPDQRYDPRYKKKKSSFLGEIFDFD